MEEPALEIVEDIQPEPIQLNAGEEISKRNQEIEQFLRQRVSEGKNPYGEMISE